MTSAVPISGLCSVCEDRVLTGPHRNSSTLGVRFVRVRGAVPAGTDPSGSKSKTMPGVFSTRMRPKKSARSAHASHHVTIYSGCRLRILYSEESRHHFRLKNECGFSDRLSLAVERRKKKSHMSSKPELDTSCDMPCSVGRRCAFLHRRKA